MGLVLAVMVTPADLTERGGGVAVFARLGHLFAALQRLWIDGGYSGEDFAKDLAEHSPKTVVELVKRNQDSSGFEVLPRRWGVERTFGWLMMHRRLARDYETTDDSAEAFIYLATIGIAIVGTSPRKMARSIRSTTSKLSLDQNFSPDISSVAAEAG